MTAFPTVWVPYGSTQGMSAHLWVYSYLLIVDDFANIIRTVDCSLYHSHFRSSTSVVPGRFAYRIPQWMAADCSFVHSSTAFTMVFAPPCSADGYADRSFVRLSTAFTTVCAPYCSADGSRLLLLPLVKGFHDGLRAIWLSRWRSGLVILSLVNGFHDGLRAIMLSRWEWIAHTSAHQRLSRWFACRIAQRMAPDCSFFLPSTAFMTVCVPYCSADGNVLLILPLVNSFSDGSRAVLLSGRQRIAYSSTRQWLS